MAKWPDEVRDQACDIAVDKGLRAACNATGVPKSTVHQWLKARGLTAWSESSDVAKIEAAAAALANRLAAAKVKKVEMLTQVSQLSLSETLRRLRGDEAKAMTMHDLVGAWTRAHHDLALEVGDATANVAVQVNFNVGRSQADRPKVVPQAELTVAS